MKTPKNKRLAIFSSGWKHFPTPPISLLDIMCQFIASEILETDRLITRWITQTKKPLGTILTKDEADGFRFAFWDIFEKQCNENGWEKTGHRVFSLKCLLQAKHPISAESLNTALWELQWALYNELKAIKFVMIDGLKSHFLENENLFGEDFHRNASVEINAEIKAAGNCLALDLKDAATFHLMRVAEFGLRQLAQHRPAINQPDLAHVLTAKRPLEEATWKMVYQAIDTEIKSRKAANTISTGEAEFYSHLMIQIRSFQFAWRDPIMHARFERPHEVDDMFDAVKKFMRELMAGGIPLK